MEETPEQRREEKERRAESLSDELEEWEEQVPLEPDEEQVGPAPEKPPAKRAWREFPLFGIDWDLDWRNGFRMRSRRRAHELHFGGRVLLDAGALYYGDGLRETQETGWDTQYEERQARLFAQGVLFGRFLFNVAYEFADSEIKDAYFGMRGLGPFGTVRAGYMKTPFSLEQRTSIRNLTFMERSLANALAPKRNNGISMSNTFFAHRLRVSLGAFAVVESFRERENLNDGFDDDWELAARITGVLRDDPDDDEFLIGGVSLAHLFASGETVDFGTRPESFLAEPLLDTEPISDIDSGERVGLEAAWVNGPLSFQAEWVSLWLERGTGSDLRYWGGYVGASWFLTGERRIYGRRAGTFTRVVPIAPFDRKKGTWGAFQVAARLSYLDLEDGGIPGGRELNATFGLNWYLLSNVRMTFNGIWAHVFDQDDAGILQARFQVDF